MNTDLLFSSYPFISGDRVTLTRITELDLDKKRVSLSIRAVLEEEAKAAEEANLADAPVEEE